MPEDPTLSELRSLDAIASEAGAALGFRVREESDDLEPVFLRVFAANSGEAEEAALISIEDRHGLSLGRYVVSRRRLEQALEGAEDVDRAQDPTVVPVEWHPG